MTEQPDPRPVPTQIAPADPPAAAPGAPVTAAPGRTRRWLAGAMLVTVGLVAGSGTTYALTSNPTTDVPGTVTGHGRGALGGPRDGYGPDGTEPDQQPGSTDQGTTTDSTTDGEPA